MTNSTSGAVRGDVRNLAIIAHVDHGKTTLLDGLLKQAGSFRTGEVVAERAMDSNDQERERGITITSKCTSITWKGTRINLVDTPGHADFGGEVERVLGMVESVLLLVDAVEGPMPQTRFVTKKALDLGLRPIVVINKIDRNGAEPDKTLDGVFDLFVSLHANDKQLEFRHIYASGRTGFACLKLEDERKDLTPLLDMIVEVCPPPAVDVNAPFCMQVATQQYDDYLGHLGIGRVTSGRLKKNDMCMVVRQNGKPETFRVQKLLGFQGLKKFELAEIAAGDICAVSGMSDLSVGQVLTDPQKPQSMPALTVDEPTITMEFMVNDSPLAGKEGKYVTSRNIYDRLQREIRGNIALRVDDTADPAIFKVSGRGELHLSVLIETMRRENFEFCVSQPQVIVRYGEPRIMIDGSPGPGVGKPLYENASQGGQRLEPYERILVDMEEPYSGAVIQELNRRCGQMNQMHPVENGRLRVEYVIPARGLIGYRSQFLTQTRGTGLLYKEFADYGLWAGALKGRSQGVLIAQDAGETNTYALFTLQERGILFMGPQQPVYPGMIIGQNSRDNDLLVNPSRAKQLTNIRSAGADEKLFLTPPRVMTLEQALEFINPDELVEVTPLSIRLRKRVLDHNARKRSEKSFSAGTPTAD